MRNGLLVIVALGLLAACERVTVFGRAGENESAPAVSSASALVQSAQPITRFAVEFTPAAQKQVDDDERFNSIDLRDAIVAELTARQLVNLQPGSGRAAVLQVDEFSVRTTSNVVIFGRVSSAGVLGGVIRIRDSGGGDASELRTRAEISMKVSRTGADRNPLKNLYKGFAKQLANDLTGAPPPKRPAQQD